MTRIRGHMSLSEIDAWLLGYSSKAPSPVHELAEIGEASGVHGSPSLNTWRVMQASAVATDVGLAALVLTMPLEPYAVPVAQRGASWYMTRFAVARYARYARLAAGPVGIGTFFAVEALQNWERPVRTKTEYQPFGPSGPTHTQITFS